MHGSRRESLFPPREFTKSSKSFFSLLSSSVESMSMRVKKQDHRQHTPNVCNTDTCRLGSFWYNHDGLWGPNSNDRQPTSKICHTGMHKLHVIRYVIPWIRQVGQSESGAKTRPCSSRISIIRSPVSLFLKLSSLSRSSIALSFLAAMRLYLTEGDWWIRDNSISHEFIHTCPTFEPLLNKIHYFSHCAGKIIYCLAQFARVRNSQESIELAGQDSDALRKAFHWFMRLLLVF